MTKRASDAQVRRAMRKYLAGTLDYPAEDGVRMPRFARVRLVICSKCGMTVFWDCTCDPQIVEMMQQADDDRFARDRAEREAQEDTQRDEFLIREEPPEDDDAWSGGFARNH